MFPNLNHIFYCSIISKKVRLKQTSDENNKNTNQEVLRWSNTKLSKLYIYELYESL